MSSAEQAPLLEIKNLTVQFGGLKALSNIALQLRPGEVVGIIGPNGAGKTTLFNAISGFVKPQKGEFTLYGEERAWLAPHQLIGQSLSRTLQGVGLFQDLTVFENVLAAVEEEKRSTLQNAFLGGSDAQDLERAHMALENMYCASLEGVKASSLSYPDSKRVALARALVTNPKILLLDEPAGGLGAQEIAWMKQLIHNIKVKTSILLVEHHMDVVMEVCDRIYVLNFGELIAEGTPEQVRNNPAVIAAYLGSRATA
jgi:branched-chain amino acid transport system ATP-binding protein